MTVEKIMFPQEGDSWCGVACIAEVIKRKQHKLMLQPELAKFLGTSDENGTSIELMVDGARRLGLDASFSIGKSLKKLGKFIDKGHIVIMDWMSGHNYEEHGHYSLLESVTKKSVTLNDPEGIVASLRTFTREDFEKVWFDFEGEERIDRGAILIK